MNNVLHNIRNMKRKISQQKNQIKKIKKNSGEDGPTRSYAHKGEGGCEDTQPRGYATHEATHNGLQRSYASLQVV